MHSLRERIFGVLSCHSTSYRHPLTWELMCVCDYEDITKRMEILEHIQLWNYDENVSNTSDCYVEYVFVSLSVFH